MTAWSESRLTSNQADYDGTSWIWVSEDVWTGHLKGNMEKYRNVRWLVMDVQVCTFPDFMSVRRLSPRFIE